MNPSDSIETLLASLRPLATQHPAELREIEIAIVGREYKRAYTLMTRLKERGAWQPAREDEDALEDFWWEYGQ